MAIRYNPNECHTNRHIEAARMLLNHPAIQASEPMPGLSNRYSFVSTREPLAVLEGKGWIPTYVNTAGAIGDRYGYQKHLIRFTHKDSNDPRLTDSVADIRGAIQYLGAENVTIPELTLKGSHDGSGSFEIGIGLWELVCTNGLIASRSMFGVRIRHVGYTDRKVEQALEEVENARFMIMHSVKSMKQRILTEQEKTQFAIDALWLKYGTNKEYRSGEVAADLNSALRPWRSIDKGDQLWKVYNVVQENVIRGGIRVTSGRTTRRSRAVSSVDETIRLNQGLWDIAARYIS